MADHIALIDKGKLVIEGTPDELKREVGELKFIVKFDGNATNAGIALIKEVFDRSSELVINGNEIQVPVENTLQISDFFVKAEQRKIEIKVFSMQKPTLDDVFFKLTEENK